MAYKLTQFGPVVRLDDGATIPNNLVNTDWQAYQLWLLAGNIPQPADPLIVIDPSDVNNAEKILKAACIYLGSLSGKTPAQVRAGVIAAFQALP